MTSKHDQLLTFYTQVMGSLDFTVDDSGCLHYMPPGAVGKDGVSPLSVAAFVEGKRLVMPTKTILDLSPWDENIAFHPLSQNINNGESEVINTLQAAINMRLNRTFGGLFFSLVDFAATPEKQQAEVSAKATKYRQLVPDLKPISVERAEQFNQKVAGGDEHRFINVYLKRSAEVEGTRYLRAGIVNFPFREDLDGKEPRAFGINMSKKDQASFKALFDYILPNNSEIDTYSAGSSHSHAPSFDALLKSYFKVASRLNEVVHLHRKLIPEYKDLAIDTSWQETIPTMAKLADVVPPLPGNVGEPPRDSRTEGGAKMRAPAASAAKATAKFQQTEKPAAREVAEVKAAATADVRRDPQHEEVPTADRLSGMSFAERAAAQRGTTATATGRYGSAVPVGRYGQPPAGRYGQPAQVDNVPAWAKKGEKSMTIAGDPNPPSAYATQAQGGGRYRPEPTPSGPSFSERMAMRGGPRSGGYGGGYGRGGGQGF